MLLYAKLSNKITAQIMHVCCYCYDSL